MEQIRCRPSFIPKKGKGHPIPDRQATASEPCITPSSPPNHPTCLHAPFLPHRTHSSSRILFPESAHLSRPAPHSATPFSLLVQPFFARPHKKNPRPQTGTGILKRISKAAPRKGTPSNSPNYFDLMYSSMALAALRPAPMARITVAAPVTASPPANTPLRVVAPSSVATRQPLRLVSRPSVE